MDRANINIHNSKFASTICCHLEIDVKLPVEILTGSGKRQFLFLTILGIKYGEAVTKITLLNN